MGLIRRIVNRVTQSKTEDSVFGCLTYEGTYEGGLWVHVPEDDGGGLFVCVCGDATGPSPVQKAFMYHLYSRIAELETAARGLLRTAPVDGSNLSLYSISIGPDRDCRSERFEMGLAERDKGLVHCVEFDGGVPVACMRDED